MKFSTDSVFQTNYSVVKAHSFLHVALIIVQFLAYIVTVTINGLASAPIKNNIFELPTSNISALFTVDITPDGWTFAVAWSLIYAWQGVWMIYNITLIFRETENGKLYRFPAVLTPVFHLIVLANLGTNITWLFIWDMKKLGAAFGVLALIVATLYAALFVSHRNLYNAIPILSKYNRRDIWLVRILVHNGLAFYATWTTVATHLNFAIALAYEWNSLSTENASLCALGVLTGIIVIYFVLDVYFVEKYTRYTWSPYLMMAIAFSGVLSENWNIKESTTIFGLILLIVGPCVMFLVKIAVTVYRHKTSSRR